MMDINNLTEIKPTNNRNLGWDLSYSPKSRNFRVAANTFTKLDLENNGFKLYSGDGDTYISVQNAEHSTFYNRTRSDAENKSKTFLSKELEEALGIENSEENVKIKFEFAISTTTNGGAPSSFYKLIVDTEEDTRDEITQDNSIQSEPSDSDVVERDEDYDGPVHKSFSL